MYFEQFYLGCLAHASYMLASEGEAIVVDPQRDVEIYLKQRKNIRSRSATFLNPICTPILFPATRNWPSAPGRRSIWDHRRGQRFRTLTCTMVLS